MVASSLRGVRRKTRNHCFYLFRFSFYESGPMVEILIIFIISIISTLLTHELSLKKHWGTIRASSFLSLAFVLITSLLHLENALKLQLIFLGGSFVGMSDPKRLGRFELIIASVLFGFLFVYFISLLNGFGGALGVSAFLSCLSATLITASGRKMKNKLKSRKTPY